MNLASIIDNHPNEATALISRARPTTYGDLRDQVASLRGALTELGIRPGDRVAILCANNRYFVVSYFAILGIGAIAVPMNPLSPSAEISAEINATQAVAVVVGPNASSAVTNIDKTRIPSIRNIIATEGHAIPDAVTFDGLLFHDPAPIVERADIDIAALLFTSGTAGSPKAAMLTHGNLLANLRQLVGNDGFKPTDADITLGVLPLHHIFGLNVVLGLSMFVGASVVLVERFDPVATLETVAVRGITVIPGAPPMWVAWANMPAESKPMFASVRLASSGAAKLPEGVIDIFAERFGVTLAEGYGLTEASPVVSSAAMLPRRLGSVGVPLPGVLVRVVDPDGTDVLAGDSGEIWVKGPNVFIGYWNNQQATASALTPDGWLQTGDIGVIDGDGWLHIVDRAKDLIIVSGFNVYPAEVEEIIEEHPAVAEAAVIGTTHPYTGETVRAYVVLRPGMMLEEEAVIAFCAENLARYKCPTKVFFVDALPHGGTGKVLRRILSTR